MLHASQNPVPLQAISAAPAKEQELPAWVVEATRPSSDLKSRFLRAEHKSFRLALKCRVFGTDLWRESTSEDVKADSVLFLTSVPMPQSAELELRFRFRRRQLGPAPEMHAVAEVVQVMPFNADPDAEQSWVYARILEYRYKVPAPPRTRLLARLWAKLNDVLDATAAPAPVLRPARQR
jgi:hypothetical protein